MRRESDIMDRRHAKQHLNDVSKAIYGKGGPEAEQWASQRKDELDEQKLEDLLAALREHADTCDDAKKCVGYVETNRHRMRYKEFKAMGLCTTHRRVRLQGDLHHSLQTLRHALECRWSKQDPRDLLQA